MANDKLKLITILQKHSSGKIPYETKYQIEDSGKIIILKKVEGYPKGKFIFENGEEFDVQLHYNSVFTELKKEYTEPYYNEEVWDEFDKSLKPEEPIEKEKMSYFEVTRIVEATNRFINETSGEIVNEGYSDTAFTRPLQFASNTNFYMLLKNCGFKEISRNDEEESRIIQIYDSKGPIGILYNIKKVWFLIPDVKKIGSEYNYEEDKSLGFFYSAENYLYIAFETLERYSIHLRPLLTDNTKSKNEVSYGYQADSALKTLLAFSCECYLKSLLISEGKSMKDLKDLGHGLIELFTSLDAETMTNVFEHYKYEKLYNFSRSDEENEDDTMDEFVNDLSKHSLSFTEARYSAENSKDTNYEFLKELAVALRVVTSEKINSYYNISPFYSEINEQLNKHLLG